MSQSIHGVLEIDAQRGVIYFTPTEGERAGATLLRICSLPVDVRPALEKPTFIDLTHMKGVVVE